MKSKTIDPAGGWDITPRLDIMEIVATGPISPRGLERLYSCFGEFSRAEYVDAINQLEMEGIIAINDDLKWELKYVE